MRFNIRLAVLLLFICGALPSFARLSRVSRLVPSRESRSFREGSPDDVTREKARKLLQSVAGEADNVRQPLNRINLQMRVAVLLWRQDEKRARDMIAGATAATIEQFQQADTTDNNYYQVYNDAFNLRSNLAQRIAALDGEIAINFLRATRILPTPYPSDGYNREANLEYGIALRGSETNPQLALKIAREALKNNFYDSMLVNLIQQLNPKNPRAAAELATELLQKLAGEDLLDNQLKAWIVISLLQITRPPSVDKSTAQPDLTSVNPISVTPAEREALINHVAEQIAGYSGANLSQDGSPRGNSLRAFLNALQNSSERDQILQHVAPNVRRRLENLNRQTTGGNEMQQFYEFIAKNPVAASIEKVASAPEQYRDGLYQQVAWKALSDGDFDTARRIINDNISNLSTRNNLLKSLQQQEVQRTVNQGQTDAALASIMRLKNPQERAQLLLQLAGRFSGQEDKKADAKRFLDIAAEQFPTGRAANMEQFYILSQLAQNYVQYDRERSFAILDTLISQFNQMAEAARVLNGFNGIFYEQDELTTTNNYLYEMLMNSVGVLSGLATQDFDRAAALVARVQLPEARLNAQLTLAEKILSPDSAQSVANLPISGRRQIISFN